MPGQIDDGSACSSAWLHKLHKGMAIGAPQICDPFLDPKKLASMSSNRL